MEDQPHTLSGPLALLALCGALTAVGGGVWDDAWHTDRGRDTFFIAPHLALYGGVSAIGLALGLWALGLVRRAGWPKALAAAPLRLAIIALTFTLASAPVDNAWHEAFGRDAVIWSPPHMLGIAGTLALGVALLTQLRARPAAFAVGSGLLVAAATFPVIEYETDVPQFSTLWYLPVLGTAAALGFALLRRLDPSPAWPAARAALAHLALFAMLAAFLATQDFPAPALPLVLGPALAADWAARRGARPAVRAVALTAALYAIVVPVRNWLGEGIVIGVREVLIGAPITFIGVLIVERLVAGSRGRPPALGIAVTALLLLAPGAWAHDPGQGEPAGSVRLALRANAGSVLVTGRRPGCSALEAAVVVGRRAGVERRAPARVVGCAFTSRLSLPGRGRWFVYADLLEAGRTIEAWLPVRVGGSDRARSGDRFAYVLERRRSGVVKTVLGGLIYALMLALVAGTITLVRRSVPTAGPAA